MATITSLGVGSGLDAEAIISALLSVERKPIEQLKTEATKIESQISAFGKMQSALDDLQSATRALRSTTTWNAKTATSSGSAVTVNAGSGAAPGSYSVQVAHLAKSQMNATSAVANAQTVIGQGTLTIDIGTWADDLSGFTPDPDVASVPITIGPGEDTLEKIRDKINATDGLGVSASIVNDANGARLVLQSASSGASQGFRVQVSDDDGVSDDDSGLSRLAYDPPGSAAVSTRTQAAQNAQATINGLLVESTTNTFTDVLEGVSMTLSAETTAAVDVSVTRDTASMKSSIDTFVKAYNTLVTLLRDQTKFNDSTKTGAVLQGDRTAINLQQQLRSILGAESSASAVFGRAADIGLDVQKDGTIKLGSAKLDAALDDVDEVRAFFAADNGSSASDGLAERLYDLSSSWLDVEGALANREASLEKRKDLNQDRQDALEDRIAATEKRLRAQYAALDTRMGQLNGLQGYISQQITNWNR